MDWSRENVLVTGASGFIGGNLAAGLLAAGAHVITIQRDERAMTTMNALDIQKDMSVVRGDIVDTELVARVFNEYDVTYAFHLAAQAIVTRANRSPLSTFESNIKGTWNVLEAARTTGKVKGLVVASTDKAYGVHETLPYTEDFRLQGRFPYDASKVCADVLSQCYATTWDMPIAITRNANTYGPGDMNWTRLIPDAIRCALEGRAFEIRSDGLMQRDFMYVGDAVEGYMLLAESLERPEVRGEAFNFGTGEPKTVLEVTQNIFDIVGGPQKEPVVLNQATAEIPIQYLGVGKAERVWGWHPKVDLEQGLRLSVDWYREFLAR